MLLKDRIAMCKELSRTSDDDRYYYEVRGLKDAAAGFRPREPLARHPWYQRGYADGKLLRELENGGWLQMTLIDELTSLLNRHSCENTSNTPDFILAQYLIGCLGAFECAITQREGWYGRALQPPPILDSGKEDP